MTEIGHLDTLHVIAQIAITLIGFTAIAISLRDREAGQWSHLHDLRLFSIIMPPTTALICCFIPELLAMVMSDEESVWRLANLILGLAKLGPWFGFSKSVNNWKEMKPAQLIMLLGGFIFIAANLLAAANILPWLEMIYIMGVLWPILVGLQNFVALIDVKPGNKRSTPKNDPDGE
ncbi:MAG: hypothetical protein EP347_03185 [Alphaproteobacteria bacterium]|nr:MAG: hypothetical protein EP347_03185 [Alphaproteobacteria bacterium]